MQQRTERLAIQLTAPQMTFWQEGIWHVAVSVAFLLLCCCYCEPAFVLPALHCLVTCVATSVGVYL